ncbi:MAG TPA: histidine phosphatase family protein, partial [Acidimicrobiia bacterium]|nr:histidine phosphatase family protein [Acidimicrobiia bacterium]
AVFSSDLTRARETAEIAFGDGPIPIFFDWRLRECDYGAANGSPADQHVRRRADHLEQPYSGGESWQEAVARVTRCIDDIAARWDGGRVIVIGHVATRWALDHMVHGTPLTDLVAQDFAWREGWEYYVVRGSGPSGSIS